MKRAVLWALLLGWTTAALAYAVEMDVERNGLDIFTEIDQVGVQTIVRVRNGENFPIRCEAVFRNGPEMSRGRRATLEAGETLPFTFVPKREVVRLRVEVWCESAEAVSPGD
jgi:hypothetical protein